MYLSKFQNVFVQIASVCRPLSSSPMTSGCAWTHTGWATLASIALISCFSGVGFDMRSTKDGPWCRSPTSWHRDMLKAVVTVWDHLSVVLGLAQCVVQCVTVSHGPSVSQCPSVLQCVSVSNGPSVLRCVTLFHSVAVCHSVRSSVCGSGTVTLWSDHTDHVTQLPKVLLDMPNYCPPDMPLSLAITIFARTSSDDQTGQMLQKTFDCRH